MTGRRFPRSTRSWLAAVGLVGAGLLVAAWSAGSGLDPGHRRYAMAGAVVAVYLLASALILDGHRRRRSGVALPAMAAGGDGPPTLVAFASQTGFAERLAWQTAETLRAAGAAVRMMPLEAVDAGALAGASRALFVVSTTGEGDAPDNAASFARRVMGGAVALPGLRYGLLSLGDRSYARYCGFGRALEGWLRDGQATPLFDTVEVDGSDTAALRRWQAELGGLGATGAPAWDMPEQRPWPLALRRRLNHGSSGAPAFHVGLEIPLGATWRAGDIAEISPRNPAGEVAGLLRALRLDERAVVEAGGAPVALAEALATRHLPRLPGGVERLAGLAPQALVEALKPLPQRQYSIASLPADGRLDLLVRQVMHPDGTLGVGSGWLTAHAAEGTGITLRVRENRGFHGPEDDRPLILIGNGTGLAGLRAHLKERAAAGRRRNWLLFGERSAAHDFFFADEIDGWRQAGFLPRVDLAFSRDQAERVYVQHRLAAAAADLRSWVADGAAILVCGSRQGMAGGVASVLAEALGAQRLETLRAEGRYRRDVY